MSLPSSPPAWGKDEVTKHLDTMRNNSYATFANLTPEFRKLLEIDKAFRLVCENLSHSDDWFSSFFIIRSHSSWLSAVSLSTSAQIPDTYVVLRAALESALYGLHISKNPELKEVWLQRGESSQHNTKVREQFKFRPLIDTLDNENSKEAEVAKKLYNQCIDDGAHPNERGFMGNLNMEKNGGDVHFTVKYLNPEPLPLRLALKSTARVGVCILGIFSHVYKKRFEILGITDQLPNLRDGL